MEYVKICGLKLYEHVQLCKDNGADAIGFIYNVPSSPRNMQKHEIKRLLDQINNELITVIVVKPLNITDLKEIMNEFNATYFQIHCSFDFQELNRIELKKRKRIILALKVSKENKEDIKKLIKQYRDQFFAFLIDNSEGHGNEIDHGLAKDILKNSSGAKLIMAGGINITNVKKLIKELKPFGIDVSSSLESEKGVKDSIKIKKFLDKIREIRKI